MTKTILIFNHKGGVSKTTTTFNLGMMLEQKGKNVLMADFDPQSNLTGMILAISNNEELEKSYQESKIHTISKALEPPFTGLPEK